IQNFKEGSSSTESANIRDMLTFLFSEYDKQYADTISFIKRHDCDIMQAEETSLSLVRSYVALKITTALEKIQNKLNADKERRSVSSNRSKMSSRKSSRSEISTCSSVPSVTKSKIKLEAARVRLEYANRDVSYQLQCAEVDEEAARLKAESDRRRRKITTQQELLKLGSDFAVAEAEYRAITDEERDDISVHTSESVAQIREERIQSYITENTESKHDVHESSTKLDEAYIEHQNVSTDNARLSQNTENGSVLPNMFNLSGLGGTAAADRVEVNLSSNLFGVANESESKHGNVVTDMSNRKGQSHLPTDIVDVNVSRTDNLGYVAGNSVNVTSSQRENPDTIASNLFGVNEIERATCSFDYVPTNCVTTVQGKSHGTVDTSTIDIRVPQMNSIGVASANNTRTCNVDANQPSSSQTASVTSEFSKYLVKRELLITRFICFNDQPESFPVWRASFAGLLSELDVTPREELDLLVMYLGPKLSIQSLRNANASNPSNAVTRIWARLEERYGRPEMVDAALKAKLAKSPKIVNAGDYHRLYELADIMGEIESIKEDPRYSALLGLYDTSVGVNQILVKLPHMIQQRLIDRASRYKQVHSVAYPPFSEFTSFMRDMSARCNDPGLSIVLPSDRPSSSFTKTYGPLRQRVDVRKTEVLQQPKKKHSCLLHGPGHPLNACRLFRQKPIDERRKILRETKLCYRCCGTDAHSFRNCKVDVTCMVCSSSGHATAMHTDSPSGRANHGGETFEAEQTSLKTFYPSEKSTVSAKCTALCGDALALTQSL
ncbi:MAG: hypothetical protein ABW185_26515, partial [Sedimenticola sp.]